MNIGLYDGDFEANEKHIFNLDIMQLATYHKKKRDIVVWLKSPDKIGYFQKVYYIKDYITNEFPNFIQNKNVEYMGRAFNEGYYRPLDESIRLCAPDQSLYNYNVNDNRVLKELLSFNIKGVHLRLADIDLLKRSVHPYYTTPETRHLILHDYDILAVPNYYNLLQSIYDPHHLILAKYPILISTLQDLKNILSFRFSALDNFLIYLNPITIEELSTLILTAPKANFTIVVFKTIDKNTPLTTYPNIFRQTLNNILYLRNHNYAYRIFYKDIDTEWADIFTMLKFYGNNPTYQGSFLDFCFYRQNYQAYCATIAFLKKYDLYEYAARRYYD